MMNKKYIIIIGSISLFVILVLFFLVSKKQSQNNQTATQNSATLPERQEVNLQNVEDVKNEIGGIIQEPISQSVIQKGSSLVEFENQDKKAIPLIDFEKATNITVNKKLRSYLDNTDYRIFYCPGKSNEKKFGVYFGYNVSKAYTDLYPDTIVWMKSWEETMLLDLHSLLFPDVNFSENELNQQLQFKDGKFRYAEIRLSGGEVSSINYYISDNGVIIATDPSCLDKMVQIYEPFQP